MSKTERDCRDLELRLLAANDKNDHAYPSFSARSLQFLSKIEYFCTVSIKDQNYFCTILIYVPNFSRKRERESHVFRGREEERPRKRG